MSFGNLFLTSKYFVSSLSHLIVSLTDLILFHTTLFRRRPQRLDIVTVSSYFFTCHAHFPSIFLDTSLPLSTFIFRVVFSQSSFDLKYLHPVNLNPSFHSFLMWLPTSPSHVSYVITNLSLFPFLLLIDFHRDKLLMYPCIFGCLLLLFFPILSFEDRRSLMQLSVCDR